ncbi:hypothetical protein GCM10009758_15400 [Microbacterium hatanonis]
MRNTSLLGRVGELPAYENPRTTQDDPPTVERSASAGDRDPEKHQEAEDAGDEERETDEVEQLRVHALSLG